MLIEKFATVQDSKLTFEIEYKRLNRDFYKPWNPHRTSGDLNDLVDFEKGSALFEKSKDSADGISAGVGITNPDLAGPADDMLASE